LGLLLSFPCNSYTILKQVKQEKKRAQMEKNARKSAHFSRVSSLAFFSYLAYNYCMAKELTTSQLVALARAEQAAHETHPLAHLGPSPYKFVGVQTTDTRADLNHWLRANGKVYTTNLCGGTCDHCGTAISNVYFFEASNGNQFKLGCDCAELEFASDAQLSKQIQAAQKANNRAVARVARERREAKAKVEAGKKRAARAKEEDAKAAAEQAERALRTQAIFEANPAWQTAIDTLTGVEGFPGQFAADISARIASGFIPSPAQSQLLARLYCEATATEAFVGAVGERAELTLTVLGVKAIEGKFGTKLLYTAQANGCLVSCFHSGRAWYLDGAAEPVKAGDKITVKASIKNHEVYRGKSQTVIQRVVILAATA
jgi:hypothetical protein